MNHSNSKYFCLLKGNWQERFFELIEMFQISLHEKFAVGVPDRLIDQYNRIIVYGLSSEDSCSDRNGELTDRKIFNSFYGSHSDQGAGLHNDHKIVADSENSSVNLFERQLSYN